MEVGAHIRGCSAAEGGGYQGVGTQEEGQIAKRKACFVCYFPVLKTAGKCGIVGARILENQMKPWLRFLPLLDVGFGQVTFPCVALLFCSLN